MARVYLGIGSNTDREASLVSGIGCLRETFGAVQLSAVYDGPAIGFDGRAFLNLAARIETRMEVAELAAGLRAIEYRHGRKPGAPRFSPRRLDIDILTYDDLVGGFGGVELPRDEILRHAFVLRPPAELAADERHPVTGQTYAALWAAFDDSDQPLRRVALALDGA